MTKPLTLILFSGLFGISYQVITTLIGSKVAMRIWRKQSTEDVEWRNLTSLVFGVLIQALSTSIVLAVYPPALRYVFWILTSAVLVDWRRTWSYVVFSYKEMALAAVYGLLCFSIMVGFHFGASPGDNLSWSVYKLTGITPGDSPQGLLQAQYLLYGHSLIDLKNFSMFDRPFLGGLISAEALSAIGLAPGRTFNVFTDNQAFSYFALWIALNSGFTYVVIALARRLSSGLRQFALCAVILASPFVVFNTIGAWPKLLAVYIACCAALLAIGKYWRIAIFLSGITFFTHGSFLWSHLSMSGLLILYLLLSPENIDRRVRIAATVGLIAVSFPALWFFAERFTGAVSPLRTYYLYGVSVSYGLYHSIDEIARGFYNSTSPGNLGWLPFMNLLKALLPLELLTSIASFSYSGYVATWRSFAESLFLTQFNRPLFSFCITAGLVALISIKREAAKNWTLCLALMAFFLLPLIPGMGLYRRDDHFITTIMLFSLIPLIIALGLAYERMSNGLLLAVTSMSFIEYALVYAVRYPGVRYTERFYEYYLWTVFSLIIVTYLVLLLKCADCLKEPKRIKRNNEELVTHV